MNWMEGLNELQLEASKFSEKLYTYVGIIQRDAPEQMRAGTQQENEFLEKTREMADDIVESVLKIDNICKELPDFGKDEYEQIARISELNRLNRMKKAELRNIMNDAEKYVDELKQLVRTMTSI